MWECPYNGIEGYSCGRYRDDARLVCSGMYVGYSYVINQQMALEGCCNCVILGRLCINAVHAHPGSHLAWYLFCLYLLKCFPTPFRLHYSVLNRHAGSEPGQYGAKKIGPTNRLRCRSFAAAIDLCHRSIYAIN